MERIAIIGTGYVGLVTGACFAKIGHLVTCVDIDQDKVTKLNQKIPPFFEPSLPSLLKSLVEQGRLKFTTDYEKALEDASFCFLALPTPSMPNGECDLSYLLSAAKEAALFLSPDAVMVNKSTTPVGTLDQIRQVVTQAFEVRGIDSRSLVASNPEFLREGTAIGDCLNPDRILVGALTQEEFEKMRLLYQGQEDLILEMDPFSAELAKYAANTMLALRLSMMNDLGALCERLGADIDQVKRAVGSDFRIGPNYLDCGIGFGGSCLPKDVKALKDQSTNCGHTTDFLDAILKTNALQKKRFVDKIVSHFGSLDNVRLAIWGLSFKPQTDDLREAPSLEIIEHLHSLGAKLYLHDPAALELTAKFFEKDPALLDSLHFCKTKEEAAQDSDGILLITQWPEYIGAPFGQIKETMRNATIFDGRNVLRKIDWESLGFTYYPMGAKMRSKALASV